MNNKLKKKKRTINKKKMKTYDQVYSTFKDFKKKLQ